MEDPIDVEVPPVTPPRPRDAWPELMGSSTTPSKLERSGGSLRLTPKLERSGGSLRLTRSRSGVVKIGRISLEDTFDNMRSPMNLSQLNLDFDLESPIVRISDSCEGVQERSHSWTPGENTIASPPTLQRQLSAVARVSSHQESILEDLHFHKAVFNFVGNLRPKLSEEGDKICNMALSILGPGILSIPFALKCSGLLLGFLMFSAAALLNVYTANMLLVDVKRLTKGIPLTFESMASDTYGRWCKELLRWSLLVLLFGFVCGNLVAAAPLANELAASAGVHLSPTLLLAFICCFVLTPLSMIPDISALGRISSPIGVFSLIAIVVIIVVKFCINASDLVEEGLTVKMVNLDASFLLTGPIASFAFNLQPYIFSVFYEDENKIASSHRRTKSMLARTNSSISEVAYAEQVDEMLQDKQLDKERRDKNIVYSAMFISFVIYMVAGVVGYMHFGDATKSNILLNYKKDWATSVVYVVMVTTICVCFPLNVFPLRALIDEMVKGFFIPADAEEQEDDFSWYRHTAETVCIIVAAFGVSVAVDDISVVFGITGATACTAVAYALPCAFSAKLRPEGWTVALAMTILFSVVMSALSMYQIVVEL